MIGGLVSLFRGALVVVMVMTSGRVTFVTFPSGIIEREKHARARESSVPRGYATRGQVGFSQGGNAFPLAT